MKTSVSSSSPIVKSLLTSVCERWNKPLAAPKDYDLLSSDISQVSHSVINADTLRRLFGYRADAYATIRRSTLDILSLYVGYASFAAYSASIASQSDVESALSLTKKATTVFASSLSVHSRIVLSWLPDRRATILYLGNNAWSVIDVEHSHTLSVGDEFMCSSFTIGSPLVLDLLKRNGNVLGSVHLATQHGLLSAELEAHSYLD